MPHFKMMWSNFYKRHPVAELQLIRAEIGDKCEFGCFQKRALTAESLTKRQRQILGMIAAGMTSAEIGRRLHLATTTVISHRRNLMEKLDLHSTAKVTRFGIDHGLLVSK